MNKSNNIIPMTLALCAFAVFGLACGQTNTNTAVDKVAGPSNSTPAASPANVTTPQADIAGSYAITGTNEGGGGAYDGSLNVTKRDDVYQFSWSSGGKTYDGVGVRTDNAVAVAFTEGTDGKGCGVVLYKIGADGSLDGKAGYWGVNSSEAEKAKRTSGTDLEGKYDISGSNTDGKEYAGKLDVKKDGVGYNFAWNAGTAFTGFGIRNGDKVAVGLGGKQCGFVSYEVKSDGILDGKWGSPGSTSIGTEVAKKK